MSTSHKKVIVRMHSKDAFAGYLPLDGLGEAEHLELLDLAGKVVPVALADVKWVCFVRDFNSGEMDNPERLLKKTFVSRPRSAGVWLRLRLIDGDLLEGLATNDLTLLTSAGLFLTPPDIRSNTQRMFLPRSSVTELEVIMVIGPAGKRKPIEPAAAEPEREVQESLFT
jgi:hypothetical protein